jgi:glycine hydroxymethyltransferase
MIGGPLMHVIAAKCVAFGEALEPSFKQYASQMLENARVFAKTLINHGLSVTTGGTDSHLLVLDLQKQSLTGKEMELVLHKSGLTCNKNSVPNDPQTPFVTSGLRFGTPAGTTRGFKTKEFEQIANWIAKIIQTRLNEPQNLEILQKQIKTEVKSLCEKFPIYE